MVVPGKSVAEASDLGRERATTVRRKPQGIYDNE